ncbi:MAG: dTMP kinase [Deltaproteobacteria bacterium]|nr:dTMP kinase [Deltaproteobacteria bacterium]
MTAGKLVVIEGIDGAGTTTQTERYAEHLRARGLAVHTTRQPSRGPVGSFVRQALGGEVSLGGALHAPLMALLFAADRLAHLAAEIEPRLAAGAVVLCDRYDLSSIAYQTSTAPSELLASGEFEAWVRSLNRFARRPDVTLVVDVTPEVAERRRATRSGKPDIYEYKELQARLAALYREAERLAPGDAILHVDGDPSLDEVTRRIRAALDPLVLG